MDGKAKLYFSHCGDRQDRFVGSCIATIGIVASLERS
jgi:hypothetical protein